MLAGVGAQYESEMVYHSLKKEWEDQGVIFDSIEDGLRNHPDLFREYFCDRGPAADNKFAALNSAVWSGGSFVYIPKGVKVDMPLQAYFRVNSEKLGQFERTLIIVDEGAQAHYIEGCTAPVYSTESFHSGVIEIIVKKGARFRYTTIQNWSNNMYNLVTQRAMVHEDATMEWLDGNLGSQADDEVPVVLPGGRGRARRDHVDRVRRQRPAPGHGRQGGPRGAEHDVADRVEVDLEGHRRAIVSRALQGRRGRDERDARTSSATRCCSTRRRARTRTRTSRSRRRAPTSATRPRVSKIGDEQLFYLMSRGLSEEEAAAHDRARLHRADRQAAAARVRGGAQPADRAGDGRLGWLRTC